MGELEGLRAVVTGAASGIGLAIAHAFAVEGASVAMLDRQAPPAGAVPDGSLPGGHLVIEADVTDDESVRAAVRKVVEVWGGIDIVVNNAGIIRDKTLKNLSPMDWQQVIDTNLTGVFNVCKAATPALREGGRIVSLASIAAAIGFFGQANYAAAKAGVVGLTKVLSRELAKRRITVNAVAPGVVLTEMGKSIPEEARAEMLKSIPLARFGEPREIADVVLFLCSDLASYMTGQTLHVNGGWYAP